MPTNGTKVNPWDRQPDESAQAYRGFQTYLNQPPTERNIAAAYRQIYGRPAASQPAGFFAAWAGKYQWRARAREWDSRQASIEHEAKLKVIASEARKWEKRRQQIEEDDFMDAQRLRQRARDIMALPITQQTLTDTQQSPDGRTIINNYHVEPIKVRAADAGVLLKLASERQRLAAEMATQIIETITPESQSLTRLAEAKKAFEDGVAKWPEFAQQIAADLAVAYSDPHRGIVIQPDDLLPPEPGITEIDGVQ